MWCPQWWGLTFRFCMALTMAAAYIILRVSFTSPTNNLRGGFVCQALGFMLDSLRLLGFTPNWSHMNFFQKWVSLWHFHTYLQCFDQIHPASLISFPSFFPNSSPPLPQIVFLLLCLFILNLYSVYERNTSCQFFWVLHILLSVHFLLCLCVSLR